MERVLHKAMNDAMAMVWRSHSNRVTPFSTRARESRQLMLRFQLRLSVNC